MLHSWLKCFLNDRTIQTRIIDAVSSKKIIEKLPQWYSLSCTLFLIYINDLPRQLKAILHIIQTYSSLGVTFFFLSLTGIPWLFLNLFSSLPLSSFFYFYIDGCERKPWTLRLSKEINRDRGLKPGSGNPILRWWPGDLEERFKRKQPCWGFEQRLVRLHNYCDTWNVTINWYKNNF